eukprot:180776_1
MALTSKDSLSNVEQPMKLLDLKKATSTQIHKQLKKATGYGLTQSITKWLLIEENEKLLSEQFTCVRWSQTKGFIVLKKCNSKKQNQDKKSLESFSGSLILYVDLLGAMNSLLKSQNDDINHWLSSNFSAKTKKNEEQKQQHSNHKIIQLKQLYDILLNNWGESCIKVSDHKAVNGVIEFRVIDRPKKKCNMFYESFDDLFTLLEEEAKEAKEAELKAMVNIDDWIKTNPKCLRLSKHCEIDVGLTINAMDDTVVSGHIYILYDEKDGALFFSMQYDTSDKKQVTFAKEFLQEFGLNNKNIIHSEKLKGMKIIMQLIQDLLKKNKLNVQ